MKVYSVERRGSSIRGSAAGRSAADSGSGGGELFSRSDVELPDFDGVSFAAIVVAARQDVRECTEPAYHSLGEQGRIRRLRSRSRHRQDPHAGEDGGEEGHRAMAALRRASGTTCSDDERRGAEEHQTPQAAVSASAGRGQRDGDQRMRA